MTLSPGRALIALVVLFALFWAVSGIALLLGAPDLGSAMTFGLIAFVGGAFILMLRSK